MDRISVLVALTQNWTGGWGSKRVRFVTLQTIIPQYNRDNDTGRKGVFERERRKENSRTKSCERYVTANACRSSVCVKGPCFEMGKRFEAPRLPNDRKDRRGISYIR